MSKEIVNRKKTGGLGRGLGALLKNADTDITVSDEYRTVGGVQFVYINQIEANPFQPRTEFEQKALNELSESIKIHGLIQPVTVRKMGYDKYQLISGERRTRASILAGLEKIPAYVRIANDQEMLEMALIENIQRENLNAIEVALSYKRLLDECQLKQEELGERVGKDRSTVSNYLRLLRLPDEVQLGIQTNKISMGHAKAILTVEDIDEQINLYRRILNDNLSVRGSEELAKQAKTNKTEGHVDTKGKNQFKVNDSLLLQLENLNQYLESKIAIKSKGNKGEIVIPFKHQEDLERILNALSNHE
ncbi:MAG: ParB/RepB/Spo0J family partition protein [Bacteroidota bacterium]|nr:ParB/RepB/Spo0J family partition protein [Bacteroidota bacterium]